MDISLNFIVHSKKLLETKDYDEKDLDLISEYLLDIDINTLIMYNSTQTFLNNENDLGFYLSVLNLALFANENEERYEYCLRLHNKKKLIINTFKLKTYETI